MAKQAATKRNYPWTTNIDGTQVKLRLMTADDKDAVLAFACSLPEDDLLFLSFDITQESFVKNWIRRIEAGKAKSRLKWGQARRKQPYADRKIGRGISPS